MKLARTIRLDISDTNVFQHAADAGEWAISGGFAFSNFSDADLTGQARQAFAHGWLGLDSFGRASVVVVTSISEFELETLELELAAHFVRDFGAPSLEVARPVAREELNHMRSLCEDHADNTLLVVSRELTDVGVRESFRAQIPSNAPLDIIAVHGDTGH